MVKAHSAAASRLAEHSGTGRNGLYPEAKARAKETAASARAAMRMYEQHKIEHGC